MPKISNIQLKTKTSPSWLERTFPNHVAQISADSVLHLRSAVKDVARVMMGSVPYEIEELTKKFEKPPQGISDKDFIFGYEDSGALQQGSIERDSALQEYIIKYPEQWKIVQRAITGVSRQKTRHASAIAVLNQEIDSFIPTEEISGVKCTSYTAPSVEAVGGVKMDFLCVNQLNDIEGCIRIIQKSNPNLKSQIINKKLVPKHRLIEFEGDAYDIWDLPEKQEVFKDITFGHTETVFQFGSSGAQKWLKYFQFKRKDGKWGIGSIEDMAVFTALDRPGPLDVSLSSPEGKEPHNALIEYTRRLKDLEPTPDIPTFMNTLLEKTHGILIYQEQIEYLYRYITDCSGAEAEEFRSDIAKKKMEKVLARYSFFLEKATIKLGKEQAEILWGMFKTFGNYSFCIDGDQLVKTLNGPKKMSELSITDLVASWDKERQLIIYESPTNVWQSGNKEVYEIELEDGSIIQATKDHKFLYDGEWVELNDLIYDIQEVMVCHTEKKDEPVHAEKMLLKIH